MIGRTIGRYRIEKELAIGGMGEVYLATDIHLDRPVALKLLPPQTRDAEARERLLNEARAASKLNHPNILTIYTEETAGDEDIIVMEYVAGRTLQDLAAGEELDVRRIIDIAVQIADGLEAAHRAGIIHRDIKPANIIVTPDWRAKIMDFGLATHSSVEAPRDGTMTGTVAYASPEQIQGRAVDHRTDLWSLGVLLYELLAGRRPFQGEHLAALAYAIVHETPESLEKLRPHAPVELRHAVERCLAKQLDQRYQSAGDLLSDLRDAHKALEVAAGGRPARAEERQPSIGVLPFANLSADQEQEYFCEGMAEEITTALTRILGLRVAARASAFAIMKRSRDLREVGRKLNVETLLEGSVRKSGERLRISARLIDAANGYHLWSERYDRELKDIFAIQDEIAENIVRALRVILSDDERRAIAKIPTSDLGAYDHYLRGRQFFHQGRKKSLQYARRMFRRAADIDPHYALAYAGIADCCSFLVHWYGDSADANVQQADAASLKALELDPELADVHATRGLALWLMKQLGASQEEFETAIRIDPRHFEARYFYARASFQHGDFERAVALFEEACKVRDDHEARFFAAQTYAALERDAEALDAYRRAWEAVDRHVELNPDDARALTMGAVSLCRLGEQARGLEWAERALAVDAEDAGVRYNVACLYALEGQPDRALDCLEEAVKAGFANTEWFGRDPDLKSLHGQPRFVALLSGG